MYVDHKARLKTIKINIFTRLLKMCCLWYVVLGKNWVTSVALNSCVRNHVQCQSGFYSQHPGSLTI